MPGKNLAPTRDCDAESPIRAAASDAGDAALRSAAPQRSAVGARLAEAEKGELRGLGSSWTPIPTWTCNERFDLAYCNNLALVRQGCAASLLTSNFLCRFQKREATWLSEHVLLRQLLRMSVLRRKLTHVSCIVTGH